MYQSSAQMFSHAPFSWLCDFTGLSLRQLVKCYHYAAQWPDEYHLASELTQIRLEISRRIA